MKTFSSVICAALLFFSVAAPAQQTPSQFEQARLTSSADGSSCVQLNWKKGGENTAYYFVERSSNGKDFRQIALVFTAEDPAFCDFAFRDKSYASAGHNVYYRIVLVSEEKELTYLPVRKADLSAAVDDSK